MTLLVQLSDPHADLGPGDRGSAHALEAAVAAEPVPEPPGFAVRVLVVGDVVSHVQPVAR